MKQKVVILGAGVGGLACAHGLSKNPNYEVHIYERNKEIGGQARSSTNAGYKHTEYCWHAFSSEYTFFLEVLNEVYDAEGVKLISHLKPLSRFIYAFNDRNHVENGNSFITQLTSMFSGFEKLYGKPVPLADKIKLISIYMEANTLCDKNLEKYDSIKWSDYLGNISSDVRRWVLDSTSIYLGMDYANLSTHFVFHMMRGGGTFDLFISSGVSNPRHLLDTNHVFYSLDGPMNEVLFNNWQKFLEERGVRFHLNHTISHIETNENRIQSVTVSCDECKHTVEGDIIVNSLSADQLAILIPTSNNIVLDMNSRQVQTQVLYYLPYRVQPVGTEPTILIMPDTPWFLMTRIEGDLWETKDDHLSTGIGIWDRPGLFGKAAIDCTRIELAEECWAQICASQHNLKLPKNIPKWDIWHSFQFDDDKKKINTYEPKFSNNIDTFSCRPTIKDKNILNMYNATAYTKTKMNIFNMESGVEAGINAARCIMSEDPGSFTHYLSQPTNWFFTFCRWVDNLFS